MIEVNLWLLFIIVLFAGIAGFMSARLFFKRQKASDTSEMQNQSRVEFRALIDSFEESQKYLSEKLHDTIGPLLAAAKMKLEVVQLKKKADEPIVKDALMKIQDAGIQLGELIQELHPVEIENYGLKAALTVYIGRLRKNSGLNIKFHCFDPVKTEKNDEILLFRIISQAVKNSTGKPGCKNIELLVHQVNGNIKIFLNDDCKKDENTNSEPGSEREFIKIRKLTDTLGGSFQLKYHADKGTSLKIIIPGAQ